MPFKALKDIRQNWDLIRILSVSTLKAGQKNTFLGYLWWLLDPMLLMVVYTILVVILGRGKRYEAFPVFLFCTLMPYKFVKSSFQQSVAVFSRYEALIKRVRFPKVVLPVSLVLSNFVQCVIGVIPMVALAALFGIMPTARLVLLPIPFVVLLLFVLGAALLFSAFGVFFHDLENILGFVTRVWWYLSPGLYSAWEAFERLPPRYHFLFRLNPMTHIFEAVRIAAYYPGTKKGVIPPYPALGLLGVLVASLLMIGVGYAVFRRLEQRFAKVL